MKKRMTILALLLAGAVTLGSYGMVQAGQEKREVPVAGVTQTLAQVLKEAGGVQAQTADVVEELQSNAAVARMMEPEMVAAEAWDAAEIAENELPQTASEFADIAVAQVNHYVNVRQEPDTESEILGKLYDKSAATVLETTEDGWYRITSGNVNGYVKAEYVVGMRSLPEVWERAWRPSQRRPCSCGRSRQPRRRCLPCCRTAMTLW